MKQNVNQRIKMLRDQLGLSREQFSEPIDVGKQGLYYIETGTTKSIPLDLLEKISESYKCNFDWLVKGVGEPFPDGPDRDNQSSGESRYEVVQLNNASGPHILPGHVDKSDPKYRTRLEEELRQKQVKIEELEEENEKLWDILNTLKKQHAKPGKNKAFEYSLEPVDLPN